MHNSTYPKVAVQWLNEALCFYQSLCLVDSEVLRNRHLRQAANLIESNTLRLTVFPFKISEIWRGFKADSI
jgi:hypothetical protein